MEKPDIVVFDIDGTLTRSKQPMAAQISELLLALIRKRKVAIISGAGYDQFKWQVLDRFSRESNEFQNLYLLPADGTVFCGFNGEWQCEHDDPLPDEEKKRIKSVFEKVFEESGFKKPNEIYGELVEDRGTQLNFSALGQNAPIEFKEAWDPDNKKREQIITALEPVLPGYSMRIGGTTSIEITRIGVDKAYGIGKLLKKTGISKEKVLYIGDKLFKGGNDEPVIALGIKCKEVSGPEETKEIIT